MAEVPRSLAELLVAEDDIALLDFRCRDTGVLLWPLIRVVFVRMMMTDFMYGSPLIEVGSATRGLPLIRAMDTFARSVAHNARTLRGTRARADIAILTDSLGVSCVDGKWFNRLSDHFALTRAERTLVIEEQWEWKWRMPRRVPRIIFHLPWQVSHLLNGKLRARRYHRGVAAQLIEHASALARDRLGWRIDAVRRAQLVGMLAEKLAGLPHRVASYGRLLDRVRPRVLLIDSGCYGTSAALVAAARERSIATAEFQHGAISAGHDAYNLAPRLCAAPAYRNAIPDHFLAFGRWWADQINMPVDKVVIGNPHRDAQLAKVPRVITERRDLLLLGDGIESDKYMDFGLQCARALAGSTWRVVFRPHPLERAYVAKNSERLGNLVAIDLNPDIYRSLAAAGALISEQSSGLFEAIGLSARIFVWRTPKSAFGFPVHPFASVETAEGLAAALRTPDAGVMECAASEAIWATGWRDRYSEFLDRCGVA